MKLSERRARERVQYGLTAEAADYAAARLGALSEAILQLLGTVERTTAAYQAGSVTAAQDEAVARWAVSVGPAFQRVTDEIARAERRLRQIIPKDQVL